MAVQCGPITPLCHNGDLRQCCPAHEEENVGMTCFSGRVNVHTCRNSKETYQLHLLGVRMQQYACAAYLPCAHVQYVVGVVGL